MQKVVVRKISHHDRKKKSRELNWRKIVYGLLVIVLLLSIGLLSWSLVKLTVIKDIKCYDEFNRPCLNAENNYLAGYKNTFLINNWFKIPKEFQFKFDYIKEIKISIDWQRQVVLEIVRDKPVAMISTELLSKQSRYYRISKEGVIIDEVDVRNNPIYITSNLATAIGSKLSNNQAWVIKLLDELSYDGIEAEAKDQDFSLIIKAKKNEKVLNIKLVANQKKTEEIINWLRILMNDNQIISESFIDLSFDKPVLLLN